jgi:hypothetical protein
MRQQLVRDGMGRILGSVNDYWDDEDESYFDYKESHITYPRHDHGKSSPVTTFHISELNRK